MDKHTPEPWSLVEVGVQRFLCPADSDKTSILTIVDDDGVDFAAVFMDADARRIVACVNALQGVPTEQLESAVAAGITDVTHGNSISAWIEIKRQRDELLSLLKEASDYLDINNMTSIGHGSILHQKFREALCTTTPTTP